MRFHDATEEAGIHFVHSSGKRNTLLAEDMGSGAGWGDYDNDGDLDLYIVNQSGPLLPQEGIETVTNILYQNNGDGTFTDVTEVAGVGDRGFGMGCAFADYDNDGDLDLYVTNYGPNVLYRNDGDGTFSDVTDASGVDDARWSTGAAWSDYDLDGDLDLYVANYVRFKLEELTGERGNVEQYGMAQAYNLNPYVFDPQDNTLFRNNGDGTFSDATAEVGVSAHGGRSLGVVFADFDLDGDDDLYVANDLSPNFLFCNNGDGTFTDVSNRAWVADFRGSMGIATADFDNDLDLDLFITHWTAQENALYRNMLDRYRDKATDPTELFHFTDDAYLAGIGEQTLDDVAWGTDLFDYDNDGDLDLFVANGHTFQMLDRSTELIPQPDRFWQNEGDGTFTEISESVGIRVLPDRVGRGVAFGDYDNDGDVDFFVVNSYAPATLWRNEGGDQYHWLQISLLGKRANRNGIGALVFVYAGEQVWMDQVQSGSSYLCSNDLRLHFGLVGQTRVDRVEIRWPGGGTQRIEDVAVDQHITLVEGESQGRGK